MIILTNIPFSLRANLNCSTDKSNLIQFFLSLSSFKKISNNKSFMTKSTLKNINRSSHKGILSLGCKKGPIFSLFALLLVKSKKKLFNEKDMSFNLS